MDGSNDADDPFGGVDFWRIDAKRGLFYAARALEDDTKRNAPKTGKTLDFSLPITRTAEVLAVAVSFTKYLCNQANQDSKIPLTIKWSGLNGRVLATWANPARHLSGRYECHTDVVKKNIQIPLSTTQDQIVLFTKEVVDELFLNFDGWTCPSTVIQDLTERLFSRRL